MERFCDVSSRNDLADFLKVPKRKLTHVLYIKKVNSYYSSFEVPKRNGEMRNINAPHGDLKGIQRRLADALFEYQCIIWEENNIVSNISHAFEKNKSIITNAVVHRNKRFVLNIDLENFFDSFHFGRVSGFFEKNKYFLLPHEAAVVISQLACYNGVLPQGAPTSPIITNLICQILDMKILKLARKYKLDYTRYADDLTFSTNDKAFLDTKEGFCQELTKVIVKEGFSINDKKTRLQYHDSKQIVTGLVVNKKINVDRLYYRNTKAMADHLYKTGEFSINGKAGTIQQLEGRFAFINQIDKYNNKLEGKCGRKLEPKQKQLFRNLNAKEKQYQKFLFFKYFYSNSMPLIITEGKTDVVYLKAALKNLCSEYPELISKKEDGSFEFKISFFKRTKRWKYFFDIDFDGADTLTNFCKFFLDTTDSAYCNYYKSFSEKSGGSSKNPVIMVFDNEISNAKKPLNKFVKNVKSDRTKEELEKEIKNDLMSRVVQNGNLFVVTNPLVEGKLECEIEELFDEKTRNHKINDKTLSLQSNYDIKNYYGKEIFSQYISSNYKTIDFSRFKPMLDNIRRIAIEWSENGKV